MDAEASVSLWLQRVKEGDEEAATELYRRYFPSLVELASKQLRRTRRLAGDEEDAAIDALHSFFRAAKEGRFEETDDRESLTRLLAEMTRRKAVDMVRAQMRQKRGGNRVVGESAMGMEESSSPGLDGLPLSEVTPEIAIVLEEQLELLFEMLTDDEKDVVLAKLAGNTNEEIATTFGYSIRTVERRMRTVRQVWKTAVPTDEEN